MELPMKIDWSKMQVKATALAGMDVVGWLNRHRGDGIVDCYGETIRPGDFYVFDWREKIDTGIYGVNYAIVQDSIELAAPDECL